MTEFVLGIFVIQVLGGLYQMGILTAANSRDSTARASRLPDLLVFSHALLGLLAAGLWLGQLFTGNDTFAWTTLVVLLLSVAGGTVMFVKTEFRGETVDHPAADPADTRVAEKQIPKAALYGSRPGRGRASHLRRCRRAVAAEPGRLAMGSGRVQVPTSIR